MQDESGYFCYRKLRRKGVKILMLHRSQGTMFCALVHLLLKIGGEVDRED